MATTIIIIALIFELSFTYFCLKTKSNQDTTRNRVRIAAFMVFIVAILTNLIQWSFRWYFLGGLLTLFAVIGGIGIFIKSSGVKQFKSWETILRGVAMSSLIILATLPAIVFPQYKNPGTTGDFEINTVNYTFTDNGRLETFSDTGEKRKLNIEFWYPDVSEGQFPLVIFSHGAFGVKMSNSSTFMELASNGYVVCSIDHPYHAAGTVDADGNLTLGSADFVQEVIDANNDTYTDKEKFEIFSKWLETRTGDINFVLDTTLVNVRNKCDEVYGLIDNQKIALMGHSLGGAASVELGRERDDISAVINLDGSMLGEYGIDEEGEIFILEKPYPVPMLNFYSQYVIDEIAANPDEIYVNKHISSISRNAYETYIKGSNHMSYTDLPLFSPILASKLSGVSGGATKSTVDEYYCIETMNRLVLEFFNCHVKEQGIFAVDAVY